LTLFLYILGHSYPKFTVHNALSYYSIKHSDRQDYHVTACFSPRGKYLAGSPYHKSPAVGKALGEISQLSINGCVITNDTFSARVSLTKKQRALWMNDDQTGQQQRKRGTVKQIKFEQYWTPVCCYRPERLFTWRQVTLKKYRGFTSVIGLPYHYRAIMS
jgi:hypothetical protein